MRTAMLLAALLLAPAGAAASDHDRITAAADAAFAEFIAEQPLLLLRNGKAARRLPDPSPAARAAFAARAEAIVAPLAGIDRARLPLADAVLLYKLDWFADRARADAALADYVFPIGGYTAPVLGAFDLFAQYPLETAAQRDDYLALLADAARQIDTMVPRLQAQAARGIAVPKACLDAGATTWDGFIAGLGETNDFVPGAERLQTLAPADARAFAGKVAGIVAAEIKPAAQRFVAFARGPSAASGSDRIGMAQYPGGSAAYGLALRAELTQSTSAAAVNALGRAELARVAEDRAALFRRFGHSGDASGFEAFIKANRPDFVSTSRADYGRRIDTAAARIKPLLPRLFRHQPVGVFKTQPMPAAMEASVTFGWFQLPAKVGEPGIYFYNGSPGRPMLGAGTLAWHEGMPGHFYQYDLVEARGAAVPPLLRDAPASFFSEGWAVYATTLASELGLAVDDVDGYDLVQDRGFMSARLVVDTGLNGLAMTTAEATDMLRNEAGLSAAETLTEVMRYGCQMPGQALGYAYGALAIAAARARAEAALGKAFDIRSFHDSILRHGDIGQAGLDRIVDDLIARGGHPEAAALRAEPGAGQP